jgi:hypothetical protein
MKTYLPSLAFFLFACDSDKGVTVFNPNPEAEISSPYEFSFLRSNAHVEADLIK